MKIRLGHVTNSSSSSYIIAIDKNLEEATNSLEEFAGWIGYDSVDEMEKRNPIYLPKVKKALSKGKFILSVDIEGLGADHTDNIKYLLALGGIKAKVLYRYD